jgi:hypothetical protein
MNTTGSGWRSVLRMVVARVRRGAAAALVGALVAAALSGCIRMDERITFDAQGAGTYELTYGIDTSLLREMASSAGGASVSVSGSSSGPMMSDAEKADLATKLGPGTEVESATVTEDGTTWEGVRLRVPFGNVERFNALGPELAASGSSSGSGSPSESPVSRLTVTVNGDTYTASGRLESMTPSGGDPAERAMAKQFFATAIHLVRISVPGQVTATNADRREGNTYVWENEGDDPGREIRISWRPAGNPAQSVQP